MRSTVNIFLFTAKNFKVNKQKDCTINKLIKMKAKTENIMIWKY